jgi:pyruvate dehydrogenase E1 component
MPADIATLRLIEQRVLWLATRIIDSANHDRPNDQGIKVGGHQASSASMVSIMTALWFGLLDADDRVSVKPHASPVLHAINYLLGRLDRRYLTELRSYGGLQAYPSRTKDPDPVDFSTGSVGLGATAPLFAAAARRYVDLHFGERAGSPSRPGGRSSPRFVALMGDAELDEGNVWEAILEPAVAELGNVLWVVDLNRQSLDRVVPGMKVRALEGAFHDAGWQVIEVKYGQKLRAAFEGPKGDALRSRIDEMPNDEYQSLFGLASAVLRDTVCAGDDEVRVALEPYPDDELHGLVGDLGGHDLASLLDAYASADASPNQPTVVFAYTIKGWGLPFAGDPMNHAAIMSSEQITAMRDACGLTVETEWDSLAPDTDAGRECVATAARLERTPHASAVVGAVPDQAMGALGSRPLSTQEAFGRVLSSLARTEAGERLVTLAPDVSISTNLGGWINKAGVFSPVHRADLTGERSVLRWEQSPGGQHIELGISEMNLFSMLAQLGLTRDFWGEPLLPVGTVYDPFVCRGLDALIYALYNGARFVIAGTPSGVTLSPEGGAHQSTITASIGLELPGLTLAEPAYAVALDWLLCDGLQRIAEPAAGADSLYLRLSTRPLDQAPFTAALERLGEGRLRADVLAGGYRVVDPPTGDGRERVTIAASGPVLPEVLEAARLLDAEEVAATVVDVTSLDRLYRGWAGATRAPIRDVSAAPAPSHVASLLPPGESIVTVHDAASHAMAWLGSVHGARVVPLGVDDFGQSGTIADLYRRFDLSADAITTAAILAVS